MIDIDAVMADFAVRQAQRQTQVVEEIQQLKIVILPRLQDAGIARVEIRFDGCGDSGAVEECVCLGADGASIACPDVTLQDGEADKADRTGSAELHSLGQALEQLTYLALERHHPGWEINDGSCGELVIDVAEATFVLDCSLRFTATDDHSTEL
ncbi:DUF6878 family protein [Sphingobium fuliginis]|uniref:DUF6878 domain-containing protein n=1 Tax=Sphingobium fuliginis ATCC 27551 TaxID=1208342 RepID=A0A5B8CDY3_SPHSA|nr:DUF6878 family protein [Sphingobium fuliginis]QDC36187.1 hypothetical protein FIL70_01915 [Sphingobium fuliginis ATCC 27551]